MNKLSHGEACGRKYFKILLDIRCLSEYNEIVVA